MIQQNQRVLELAGRLMRSLLQYVPVCAPWSRSRLPRAQATIAELIQKQQRAGQRLGELLDGRGVNADLPTFPLDFARFHYVSWGYLLPELLQDQERLVEDLDEAAHSCLDDLSAASLFEEIRDEQRAILERLRQLAAEPQTPAPA
jgi:hypothetical protein